jgi:hypothetical protein
MSDFSKPRAKRKRTVIAVGTVALAFVACGGRSNLVSGDVLGGDAGIAGARAAGGVGGTLGGGGASGSAGAGGGGGSNGYGGFGGGGFGGTAGFGESGTFGGTGLGGAAGSFGGSGFGGSFGAAGSGGTGGGSIPCDTATDPCNGCICRTCNAEFASCSVESDCQGVAFCFLSTKCTLSGNCDRACAGEISAATPGAVVRAQRLVDCLMGSGCPCDFGSGGAAGSGGTGGGPIDCGSCYRAYCPGTDECVQSGSCLVGIECAFENCYRNEWIPLCVVGCFGPDQALGMRMASALQCVTTNCWNSCFTGDGPWARWVRRQD